MNLTNNLGYYFLNPSAMKPEFATEGSACFDLAACLRNEKEVKVFGADNIVRKTGIFDNARIYLGPFERALIPTGLVFDIPSGYVLKIYPRSGASVKEGIGLINSVGVVDSDYVEQVYLTLFNKTNAPVIIEHGVRYAQAMLEKVQSYEFKQLYDRPEQKTSRSGGFGSTGKR